MMKLIIEAWRIDVGANQNPTFVCCSSTTTCDDTIEPTTTTPYLSSHLDCTEANQDDVTGDVKFLMTSTSTYRPCCHYTNIIIIVIIISSTAVVLSLTTIALLRILQFSGGFTIHIEISFWLVVIVLASLLWLGLVLVGMVVVLQGKPSWPFVADMDGC
jgi:hypothetical protein